MMPGLVDLGHWVLSSTVQTGVIVGVLAGLGGALGRYLSPRWVAALWLLVLVRLVVPWSPGAPAGLHPVTLNPSPYNVLAPDSVQPLVPSSPASFTPTIRPVSSLPPSAFPLAAGSVWLLGSTALAVRWIRREAAFRRGLRLGHPVSGVPAVPSGIRVWEAPAVEAPAAFGVWHPKILMPPGLLDALPPHQQGMVMQHELSHIRRLDIVSRWLMECACVVYWFNPFVWIARRQLRTWQELAADDAALRDLAPDGRVHYGAALLAVAALSQEHVDLPSAAGMQLRRLSLARRIRRIRDYPRAAGVRLATVVAAAVVLLGSGATALAASGVSTPEVLANVWSVSVNRQGGATVTYRGRGGQNARVSFGQKPVGRGWMFSRDAVRYGGALTGGFGTGFHGAGGPFTGLVKIVVHWDQGATPYTFTEIDRVNPSQPNWLRLVSHHTRRGGSR